MELQVNDRDGHTIFRNHLSVKAVDEGIIPLRFTAEQLSEYHDEPVYRTRSLCPAGICIDVVTDAQELTLEVVIRNRIRPVGFFDLFIENLPLQSFEVQDTGAQPHTYRFPLAVKSQQALRRVTLYFPQNMEMVIRTLKWSDGSQVLANPAQKRSLLCLGDSITQGMDADHPAHTYPVLLSRQLDMNVLNQGVGGYYFNAASLDQKLPYQPDLITVAYGTNDWQRHKTRAQLADHVSRFMSKLCDMFPSKPIFVITPLWRVDWEELREMGSFQQMVRTIERACQPFPAVQCITGTELLPHDAGLLADHVHPTDQGFQLLAEALAAIVGRP